MFGLAIRFLPTEKGALAGSQFALLSQLHTERSKPPDDCR